MLAGLLVTSGAAAGTLLLPSGQQAQRLDEIRDTDSATLRLRYLVPSIADATQTYARMELQVFEDMQWLCETQTRRLTRTFPGDWTAVVVTMMSRPLEFGASDPGTVQFFEQFDISGGACIWEDF